MMLTLVFHITVSITLLLQVRNCSRVFFVLDPAILPPKATTGHAARLSRSKLRGNPHEAWLMAYVHLLVVLCVLTLLPLASCASKKTPKAKVSRSGHDLSHLAPKLASWVRFWIIS